MERLTPATLDSILTFARRAGMLVLIGTDGELKGYPKQNKAFQKVREMLTGCQAEMKMHIIRKFQGEYNDHVDPT
jgi:hypothetical protein